MLQNLSPPPTAEQVTNPETGKTEWAYDEDLDDDFDSVLSRLPEDPAGVHQAITASQGCMLLLVLKEHLKDFYGLTARQVDSNAQLFCLDILHCGVLFWDFALCNDFNAKVAVI